MDWWWSYLWLMETVLGGSKESLWDPLESLATERTEQGFFENSGVNIDDHQHYSERTSKNTKKHNVSTWVQLTSPTLILQSSWFLTAQSSQVVMGSYCGGFEYQNLDLRMRPAVGVHRCCGKLMSVKPEQTREAVRWAQSFLNTLHFLVLSAPVSTSSFCSSARWLSVPSAEEILLGQMLQSTQLFSLFFFPTSFLLSSRLLTLAPFSSFSHQDVLHLSLPREAKNGYHLWVAESWTLLLLLASSRRGKEKCSSYKNISAPFCVSLLTGFCFLCFCAYLKKLSTVGGLLVNWTTFSRRHLSFWNWAH